MCSFSYQSYLSLSHDVHVLVDPGLLLFAWN
jgi:hypothetical protein